MSPRCGCRGQTVLYLAYVFATLTMFVRGYDPDYQPQRKLEHIACHLNDACSKTFTQQVSYMTANATQSRQGRKFFRLRKQCSKFKVLQSRSSSALLGPKQLRFASFEELLYILSRSSPAQFEPKQLCAS